MRTGLAFLFMLGGTPAILAQDAKDYRVQLQAKDGTTLSGTAKFPDILQITTKFGDVKMQTATVFQVIRTPDGQCTFRDRGGQSVVGKCALGKILLKTPGGELTIGEEDLAQMTFPDAAAPPAAPPQPSPRAEPKKEAKFPGFEYRKNYPAEKAYFKSYDPWLLLSTGTHVALLDYDSEECVFVELSTSTLTRVKVEGGPTCIAEKAGQVYVSNSRTNSLTVIDAKTFKTTGRIVLGCSPQWLAAPVLGDVLYFTTNDTRAVLQSVDTKNGKILGPLIQSDWNRSVYVPVGGLVVSPDNRLLITFSPESNSPCCTPTIYAINGQRLIQFNITHHENHGSAYRLDFTGSRIYTGWMAYSMDMGEKVGDLPSFLTVPHPSRSLLFGSKREQNKSRGTSETVMVFDEIKLTTLAEIPVGDAILGLIPVEKTLYVVGPTMIYPVDLTGLVPAESLSKEREKRIPVDLSKGVAEADVKKAETLIADGHKALDGGKFDDARTKFEQAYRLDPLSSARVGMGSVLVRQKKYPEAIESLRTAVTHPYRDALPRLTAYSLLGVSWAESGQPDNGIKVLREGLRLEPKDTLLLKNLGIIYGNSGRLDQAYIAWARCIQADPKLSEVKRMLEDVTRKIIAATTAKCEVCNGDGKHEVLVQEQGAAKKKLSAECKTCKGSGKAWKRPCVECQGVGQKSFDKYCDKCDGRGFILESSKTTY